MALTFEVFDKRLMSPREARRAAEAIVGKRWLGFHRKGKYLWAELEDQSRIVIHLRMTGQLIVHEKGTQAKPRLRVSFQSGRTLSLYDQRRFAEVWHLAPGETWRSRNPIGPDALNELRRDQFVRLVKSRTTRIQPLLMDQRFLSGVGNIYAQEALFKAAIRPTRPGFRVTEEEAARLFDTLQETLKTAISHRGSSNRNYVDASGEPGSAQTLHAVYRKGGKPCPRCGGTLRMARVGGRGSVFCPECQK